MDFIVARNSNSEGTRAALLLQKPPIKRMTGGQMTIPFRIAKMKQEDQWISTHIAHPAHWGSLELQITDDRQLKILAHLYEGPVVVGVTIKHVQDFPAMNWVRLPCCDNDQSTNVVKAVRADGGSKSVSVHCVDIPKRLRGLINLIDVKSGFYGTIDFFVKPLHSLNWQLSPSDVIHTRSYS